MATGPELDEQYVNPGAGLTSTLANSLAPTTPTVSTPYIDPSTADMSDFSVQAGSSGNVINQLPMRAEKQFLIEQLSMPNQSTAISGGMNAFTNQPNNSALLKNPVTASSFYIKAAKQAFKDYIKVKIPHRGYNADGSQNLNEAAVFSFLINPTTVQVNKETIDQQALTRNGWQFGVWGEGIGRISMSGSTAGEYFSLGLADEFSYFTKSYRNLMALTMFYESNGYFWEGESAFSGTLQAAGRQFIKCHQAVELTVGNFVWSGMFDTFSVHQDAEKPYLANFEISFLVWKERFRSSSPYCNPIHNDVQRGHCYSNYYVATAAQQPAGSSPSISNWLPTIDAASVSAAATAPSVVASQVSDASTSATGASTTSPTADLMVASHTVTQFDAGNAGLLDGPLTVGISGATAVLTAASTATNNTISSSETIGLSALSGAIKAFNFLGFK